MATIEEVRYRVGRILNDPTLASYSLELFIDGLGAALDAILPWVPKTAIKEITGTGESSYAIPDDCYQIETLVNGTTGEMLPRSVLSPGLHIGDTIEEDNDWIEYPHGYISFSKELSVGETYILYYLAHWTKPVDQSNINDLLEPPEQAHLGIALYTAAYMILPNAISASEVRQFNTKVDSGNPEHNPMEESMRYLLKLFSDEMNRHPKYQKAQK